MGTGTERLHIHKYGVLETSDPQFEVIYVAKSMDVGRWIIVAGKRQEIEIRVTPKGFLRVSEVRRRGSLTAVDEEQRGVLGL